MRVSCLQCYKSGKVLVSKCAESRLLSGLPKKKEITSARLKRYVPMPANIYLRRHVFFGKSMTIELRIVDGLAKILIIAYRYHYDEII